MKSRESEKTLPSELRALVKGSVALFGEVLQEILGAKSYEQIESVRRSMASIRNASPERSGRELERAYATLSRLGSEERRAFARAYTLMFELMNACEAAYRTWRLRARRPGEKRGPRFSAKAIVYVLTAHPTEARSPANIEIFHRIQVLLVEALEEGFEPKRAALRSLLALAWNVRIVRYRKPEVRDEAEHIYSVALRDENLSSLLDFGAENVPVYLRSWVGGDKDGHPGVDATAMLESLQLSRDRIVEYVQARADEAAGLIELVGIEGRRSRLAPRIAAFRRALSGVRKLSPGDGLRVAKVRSALRLWTTEYRDAIGGLPLPLLRLERLLRILPGLVVPLELREDSAVLLSDPTGKRLAIGKMLSSLSKLARGTDARFYARGMIISMADSLEQVRVAAGMVRTLARDPRIPVVPLFEQRDALNAGAKVVEQVIRDPSLGALLRKHWGGRFEVMLGYSDSSKESGVLESRLLVVEAMGKIDRTCRKHGVTPVFFHGSGGSIDRGGGSVSEQMAPWPKSAKETYKATIQGEMVERSFASPEIAESRFLQIARGGADGEKSTVGRGPGNGGRGNGQVRRPAAPVLKAFARSVAENYGETIASERFLRMVERATPYRYLSALKIGSRPTKRAGALSVPGLRAIPWVLCWTQTRVLFQTWWGTGKAWRDLTLAERAALRTEFRRDPLFRSYVHALGFTLAKIELPVWEFYLSRSGLEAGEIDHFKRAFRAELAATRRFFRELTGESDPLWFRPWLARSIELRAPLIHPLNILEILAQEDRDLPLLRISVTGIASGMLTTG